MERRILTTILTLLVLALRTKTLNGENITFPPAVVFKGDNGRYLKVYTFNSVDSWYLQFSGSKHERESQFQVMNQADGYVAVKSLHNGKYWRGYSDSYIRAISDQVDQNTLFKPIRLGGNSVAFLVKGTNKYCKRYTPNPWQHMLRANGDIDDIYSVLIVEEPVIRRRITEVVYDFGGRMRTEVEPLILAEHVVVNNSPFINKLEASLSYSTSNTRSFTRSVTISTAVETTIEAGIPRLANGQVTISTTITGSFEWGTTTSETSSSSGTLTVDQILPGNKVKATLYGERAKLKIPFRYQQVDLMTDGTRRTTTLNDGWFTGVNEYSTRYETVAIN